MGKMIGCLCLLGGIASLLYSWVIEQKMQHKRLEEFILFIQKSIFAMEEEKVRMIPYLQGYKSKDEGLNETLQEIASRLQMNIYPNGQMVWEEVFWEKKRVWDYDGEIFDVILTVGNGFFGKKRSENVCLLRKSIKQLEMQRDKRKEKDTQERKVWIPVGMLSGIMLMIILI